MGEAKLIDGSARSGEPPEEAGIGDALAADEELSVSFFSLTAASGSRNTPAR
jgi:hypothetical protein